MFHLANRVRQLLLDQQTARHDLHDRQDAGLDSTVFLELERDGRSGAKDISADFRQTAAEITNARPDAGEASSPDTPAFGGRYGAVHGLDVSGSFREARDGNDAARVADELSSSWVAFAKTGDPNNARIPPWPTFDAKTRATMIFGTPTQLENDPRSEIRAFWEHMPPPGGPLG